MTRLVEVTRGTAQNVAHIDTAHRQSTTVRVRTVHSQATFTPEKASLNSAGAQITGMNKPNT